MKIRNALIARASLLVEKPMGQSYPSAAAENQWEGRVTSFFLFSIISGSIKNSCQMRKFNFILTLSARCLTNQPKALLASHSMDQGCGGCLSPLRTRLTVPPFALISQGVHWLAALMLHILLCGSSSSRYGCLSYIPKREKGIKEERDERVVGRISCSVLMS